MDDDMEILCVCVDPKKDHRKDGHGSCAVIGCDCECFEERDRKEMD